MNGLCKNMKEYEQMKVSKVSVLAWERMHLNITTMWVCNQVRYGGLPAGIL